MYTVEYEHDTFEIVVLDDQGREDDLRVEIESDAVYISQFNSVMNQEQNIRITPEQWDEMLEALRSPEGSFIKRVKRL